MGKLLFSLRIPGLVQPKQSVRMRVAGKRVYGYQPAKVRNYEAYVRGLAAEVWCSGQHSRLAIDQPVEFRLTFYLPRPKSRPVKRYPWPDRQPDLTNLTKPVEDAIEASGVLYNDSRIVHSDVWKRYATEEHSPGAVVELFEV